MDITSTQNPRVKHIVKLREDKRQRQRDGLIFVEGFDELTMAFGCGLIPQTVLTAPELATQTLISSNADIVTVSRAVFGKISYRENPDGWIGIFPTPKLSIEEIKLSDIPFVIVAESVEKPGNLGAILRTADATGVDALLVCDPRVDLWNPNVIRASRGTVFTVRAVEVDSAKALKWLKSKGIRVLSATPSANEIYTNVDMRPPTAIVVGTEDLGLTDFWMQNADLQVKIPMMGKVNSLNVSVSTALMAYECARQRNGQ